MFHQPVFRAAAEGGGKGVAAAAKTGKSLWTGNSGGVLWEGAAGRRFQAMAGCSRICGCGFVVH